MLGTVLEDTVNVIRKVTYEDVRHAFILQAPNRIRNPFSPVDHWHRSTVWDTPHDITKVPLTGSGLQYQGAGTWHYNWKTAKSWTGQCRDLLLTLSDGSEYAARFRLR
jgi:hypothetical protein